MTSDTVVTEDDASMQIRLYARGLAAIGEQVCSGSIAFLEDATVALVPVGEEMLIQAEIENKFKEYEPKFRELSSEIKSLKRAKTKKDIED